MFIYIVPYCLINQLRTVPPPILSSPAGEQGGEKWWMVGTVSSFVVLKVLVLRHNNKKKDWWLIGKKSVLCNWTWKYARLLTLRHAFCQCGNCLISTHFIHHTWKRPDQDAPGSPAGIWGDLRELDWLSASEGIFSVGVMGEAQLRLSWNSLQHGMSHHGEIHSLHCRGGVEVHKQHDTHSDNEWKEKKGGSRFRYRVWVQYINDMCKGFLLLRTGLFYSAPTCFISVTVFLAFISFLFKLSI